VRFVAAASALALLTAAPAAAVTGGSGIVGVIPIDKAVAAKDNSRSCQAGQNAKTSAGLLGSRRRHAVVACEQPPKSNLITPDQIAKATAAALSVLG
jgi:hypothetical protein